MSAGVCICGVHPVAREHRTVHREYDRRWLRRLEATEPTGPGTLGDLLRLQIAFDEDNDAGKLSYEEFQRRASDLQRARLRLAGGLAWLDKQPPHVRVQWALVARDLREELN
jgi:hypothetical protein